MTFASISDERDTLLTIHNLAVSFGGVAAITDMNFSVNRGEVVSLIGPNGAGKTTAFNVICGFLRATKGEVVFDGHKLDGLKPHEIAAAGLVRTFQKTSVFGRQTVFDNVLMGLHRRGEGSLFGQLLRLPNVQRSERQLRSRVCQILEFVGLEHRRDEFATTLAYGEQRLLEIAIALAANPSLLLLDEPASGMNPTEAMNFRRLVSEIGKGDVTVLLVEHDMKMVMAISSRVVVLNQGKIIADGSPSEIRNNPEVIRAYLGGESIDA